MINWFNLLFNGIWILGVALALAVLSIAYYQSCLGERKMSAILAQTEFSLPLYISGELFSLGMGLTADWWWEIVLWMIMVLLLGVQVYLKRKALKNEK